MSTGTRAWVLGAAVRIAIIALGASAIAGGMVLSATTAEETPAPETTVSPSPSPEASPSPSPSPEVSPSPSASPSPSPSPDEDESEEGESKSPNHGQCVRYWVHKAKAEGLHGKFFGRFVSMVARSDCMGPSEDEFTDELATALAQQEQARVEREARKKQRGEKGKGKGKRN